MSLANVNTNWQNGSYEADRNALILPWENQGLYNNQPGSGDIYDDELSLAIGFGYDILVRPASEVRQTLNSYIQDSAREMTARQEEILAAHQQGRAINLPGDPLNGQVPDRQTVLDELANVELTQAEALTLFNATILIYEYEANAVAGTPNLDRYLGEVLPPSRERAALVSLLYNIGEGFNQTRNLIINGQNDPLQHAKIWAEIRYDVRGNANDPNVAQGLQNRRDAESNLFGLYSNGSADANSVDVDEVKQVIGFLFEAWNSNVIATGGIANVGFVNSQGTFISYEQDLRNQISDGLERLRQEFAFGEHVDWVLTDLVSGAGTTLEVTTEVGAPENSWDLIFGEDGNDTINGVGGNDVLYGGAGQDTLDGGTGNDRLIGAGQSDDLTDVERDILRGGEGGDTYYVADNDIIDDSDGRGEVRFGDDILVGGKQTVNGDNRFYGLDGTVYELNDTTLTVTSTAGTITIQNYNRDENSLGIELVDRDDNDPPPPPKPRGADDPIPSSPIALDLDGDGVETTALETGVNFDLDGNGFAEKIGFIKSDDGLLALDKDGDGFITNGNELFGDQTLLENGQRAQNGFIALREFDDNVDGYIDANDAVYEQLRVWQDHDQDGVSEENELRSLENLNVARLDLNYQQSNFVDENGHPHYQQGRYIDGQDGVHQMDDVYFQNDRVETREEMLALTPELMALPDTASFGNAHSLRQAMVRDETGELQSLVEQFIDPTTSYEDRNQLVTNILFRLTNQPREFGLRPGPAELLDIRIIGTLETFFGQTIAPAQGAGIIFAQNFQERFDQIADMFYYQLSAQSYLAPVFDSITFNYDSVNDVYLGNFQNTIPALFEMADADPAARESLFNSFTRSIAGINPYVGNNLTQLTLDYEYLVSNGLLSEYQPEVLSAFETSLAEVGSFDDELVGTTADDVMRGLGGQDELSGGEGNDTLMGDSGNDTLWGDQGNDVLLGGADNDLLLGGAGNDVLDGGSGEDVLKGESGNDTYRFGRLSGSDTIEEIDSTPGNLDVIEMLPDLLPSDIRVYRLGSDLKLSVLDTGDVLTVKNWFTGGGQPSATKVEEVRFADGTVWTISDLVAFSNVVTEQADTFTGSSADETIASLGGNDIVFGGMGNDALSGGSGDDVLHGESGADSLQGDSGDDQLRGSVGNDVLHGGDGRDQIYGGDDADLLHGDSGEDGLLGEAGNDVLDGGAGSDYLRGGSGDDVFLFGRGSANDTVSSFSNETGIDTIRMSADIDPADIHVQRDNHDLLLTIRDTGEQIKVWGWFQNNSHHVEQVEFNDGTIWDVSQIIALSNIASEGNDNLYGTTADDSISGLGGNDNLYGDAGNDVLDGGAGNDNLQGGNGTNTLIGGAGADRLYGGADDDVLQGGDDADYLEGGEGNNTLEGGAGNDVIAAHYGNNLLDGGAGDDLFYDGSGDNIYQFGLGSGHDSISQSWASNPDEDVLKLGEGITVSDVVLDRINGKITLSISATGDSVTIDPIEQVEFVDGTIWNRSYIDPLVNTPSQDDDEIQGGSGNDVIGALGGNDVVFGLEGDDTLQGGVGNDALYGGEGNDALSGGAGNDSLSGESGDDTYLFNLGDGQDSVADLTGTDTVQFGPGIAPSDVTVTRDFSNLYLAINGTNDRLTLSLWFNSVYKIEQVVFADGTVWDVEDLTAMVSSATEGNDVLVGNAGDNAINGLGGNDTLSGEGGNDTLSGGSGNDTIVGGDGNDTLSGNTGNDSVNGHWGDDLYLFNLGDGQDVINDISGTDTIQFGLNIAPADVTVTRDLNHLYLSINGGNDRLTLSNWFSNPTYQLEQITFEDGTAWNPVMLNAMVSSGTAGNDYLVGGSGDDTISGLGGNDTLYGQSGNDVLTGGAGNDTLSGEAGNDNYIFNPGDGQDVIYESTGTDSVQFGSGINPADVAVTRDVYHLYLTYGADDRITLWNWFHSANVNSRIEQVTFTDGTAWDAAALNAMIPSATEGNDTLFGGNGNDVLSGLGGNDNLHARGGDDTLSGGAGNDYLYGETGNDTYIFNRGDGQDLILDTGGVDKVQFGADIAPVDVTVTRDLNHLYLTINGTGDQLLLQSWFNSNPTYRIEQVTFTDGTVWDVAALTAMVSSATEGNDFLVGGGSNDTLSGLGGDDTLYGQDGDDSLVGGAGRDNLLGDAGDDELDGGSGNDWLNGGAGGDSYIFNRGDGQDYLSDISGADAIQFGSDIAPSDVTVSRDSNNIYLSINGTNDRLTLSNWFNNPDYQVEQVIFNDGTVWNAAQLEQAANSGTDGNDTLYGTDGIDNIDARSGNDGVWGRDGNDTLTGGAGNDSVYGESGDDSLYGGAGDDLLSGGGGNDFLEGGDGFDQLYGGDGNDVLAGSGNDTLNGDAGDDSLTGGSGSNTLRGGEGSDTYHFGLGSGSDLIVEQDNSGSAVDTLQMGAGIAPADIRVTRDEFSLTLSMLNTSDAITIHNWYGSEGNRIEQVVFDGGVIWSAEDLETMVSAATDGNDILYGTNANDSINALGGNDTVYAGAGNDVLMGGDGNDILNGEVGGDELIGGSGNDNLYGGAGNDLYRYGRNEGSDLIVDEDSTAGNVDSIHLNNDILPGDVLITRNNNDLLLSIHGNTLGALRIGGWFSGPQRQIEEVHFGNGTVWTASELEGRIGLLTEHADSWWGGESADDIDGLGGDDLLVGFGGDDILHGGNDSDELYGGNDNDTLSGGSGDDLIFGQNGNDTLSGGSGNDYLDGGTGDDAYSFFGGDGQDTIVDKVGMNTIEFDAGILPSEVVVTRSALNLFLNVGNGGDRLMFQNWYLGPAYGDLQVTFSDGTVWDKSDVMALVPTSMGTHFSDYIVGSESADTLTGLAGVDQLFGGSGDDVLDGGADADFLQGGIGNDIYLFGYGYGEDGLLDNGDVNDIDIVQLVPGIGTSDITLTLASGSLYISLNGTSDRLSVAGWSSEPAYSIEQIVFSDGTIWDRETVEHSITVPPGTPGDDAIFGGSNDDIINVSSGNDTAYGGGGNDIIDGGSGDDYLMGEVGDDDVRGGTGNDYVIGGDGQDVLTGGAGNDVVQGGLGDDIYRFNLGDGQDSVYHDSGSDSIHFGVDINPEDVLIIRNSDHLHLALNASDRLILQNWFVSSNFQIAEVVFDDGTVWDTAYINGHIQVQPGTESDDVIAGNDSDNEINALGGNDAVYGGNGDDVIYGGAGNDNLVGEAGNDTLDSGIGNDFLAGSSGNDRYEFGIGYGQDTILDEAGEADAVYFGPGITPEDIQIQRVDGHLDFSIDGIDDVLTLNWYGSPQYLIEQFVFDDGTVWNGADINVPYEGTEDDDNLQGYNTNEVILGYGGGDSIYGEGGDDVIKGGDGEDYLIGGDGNDNISGGAGSDYIYAGNGNDVLDGGEGDDSLNGGAGSDVYLFRRGDGQDVIINDGYASSNSDILRFEDVLANEVIITREDDTLFISVANSDNRIAVDYWFNDWSNGYYRLGGIEFADGTVWNAQAIENALIPAAGTEGDDNIYGGGADETLSGLGGYDQIYGGAGADTLIGGLDDDSLYGGSGNDTYIYDLGDGWDYIEERDTTLGNIDTLQFGAGILPGDVVVTREDAELYVEIGGETVISINQWFEDEAYQIERFEFADGTLWNVANIESYIEVPMGTEDSEDIYGTSRDDLLFGAGGYDYLRGFLGDDVLIGGSGTDEYEGGKGSDVYAFNSGDIATGDMEYIGDNYGEFLDSSGIDTISLGGGLLPSDIYAYLEVGGGQSGSQEWSWSALYLQLGANGGGIYVDWLYSDSDGEGYEENYDNRIERLQFIGLNDHQIFDLVGLVEERYDDLVEAWENETFIPLFTPETLTEFDVTATADLAGGIQAINYALTGDPGTNSVEGGSDNDTLLGTSGIDEIRGLAGNDTLYGFAGDDALYGAAGDDTLYGGSGNDYLHGGRGSGNDTLIGGVGDDQINPGTGNDVIEYLIDQDGHDVIDDGDGDDYIFAATESQTIDYSLDRIGHDLRLVFSEDSSITVRNWFASPYNQIETIEIFSLSSYEGVVLTSGDINNSIENAQPMVDNLIADQMAEEGEAFSFQVPTGTFSDANQDELTLSATLADGSGLPVWLSFDPENGAFSGTPQAGDVMPLQVRVTATDTYGASIHDDFRLGFVGVSLIGTSGDDFLTGTNGDDQISGGVGNDALYGLAGDDVYSFGVGAGQDTIEDYDTGTNADTIRIVGAMPWDVNVTGYLNDSLSITLDGTSDNLIVENHFLSGGNYRIERIEFDNGVVWDSDIIFSGGDPDTFDVGDGDDLVYAGVGNDVVYGGVGHDYLYGQPGDDTLYGGDGDDYLHGGRANDILYGGSGNDILQGLQGVDELYGESGDDIFIYHGDDDSILDGGDGVDLISFVHAYANGIDGVTAVLQESATNSFDVTIGSGSPISYSNAVSIEGFIGSDYNDSLSGNSGDNAIYGGDGSDSITGNAGSDLLDGGAGSDYVDYTESSSAIAVDLAGGTASGGHAEGDILRNIENILGSAWDDAITGDDGANHLIGGSGNDVLTGSGGVDDLYAGNGDDTLFGGDGNDALYGEAGSDQLVGGAGNDGLIGGAGGDYYYFGTGDDQDIITEDLGGVDAGAIDIVGFTPDIAIDELWFTQEGNHLRIWVDGADDWLQIDNWYSNSAPGIEQFVTTEYLLLASQVQQLVDAMAVFDPPGDGVMNIPQEARDEVAPVIAASWTYQGGPV